MKIEKINDNQIRCTLSKNDLASREIKISELAYGTEKAKNLFRDMMQQASFEFGFEADDLPLMIEAIPMSAESIVLIITKVDDPEELDTRFSKFAPSYEEELEELESYDSYDDFPEYQGADEGLELYSDSSEDSLGLAADVEASEKIQDNVTDTPKTDEKKEEPSKANVVRFYSFQDFKTIEQLSAVLNDIYYGKNTLYKDTKNHTYYLVLNKSDHSSKEFNRILNIVSEYGNMEGSQAEKENFYKEHFQVLIDGSALQILANIL